MLSNVRCGVQVRNYRKPLVVVAPKTLLRLPGAASSLAELGPGTSFQTVVPDTLAQDRSKVERLVFVSGKHYYTLAKHMEEHSITNVAVIRLESLCPFPAKRLQDELQSYPNVRSWVWSQEEHRNMGAWTFVAPRFENLLGVKLGYAGRGELCQPAVGVGQVHQQENRDILQLTFA